MLMHDKNSIEAFFNKEHHFYCSYFSGNIFILNGQAI